MYRYLHRTDSDWGFTFQISWQQGWQKYMTLSGGSIFPMAHKQQGWQKGKSKVKVTQSCLTLCNPMDDIVRWSGQPEWLLQGIFPTQGLNSGLPHCRRILYQLSHQGIPGGNLRKEKWNTKQQIKLLTGKITLAEQIKVVSHTLLYLKDQTVGPVAPYCFDSHYGSTCYVLRTPSPITPRQSVIY